MGVANTKIMDNDLPIEVIIKRMDECVLPDEREIVLDYMEMLEGTCYYSPFSLYSEQRAVIVYLIFSKRKIAFY